MQNINLPLYIQHKEKYIHIANSTLNDSYFISIATGWEVHQVCGEFNPHVTEVQPPAG